MKAEKIGSSCHHGDVLRQNNLVAVKNLLQNDPTHRIAILEIDFIDRLTDIVSSHDRTPENIADGSPLADWVKVVVHKHGRILWCDIKAQVDFMTMVMFCNDTLLFDCKLLFDVLNKLRHQYRKQLKLEEFIYLSCQHPSVHTQLVRLNEHSENMNRWTIISDMPHVNQYIPRYLSLPDSSVNSYVQDYFKHYDFGTTIVCIDISFFATTSELVKFIEDSRIPLQSTVLLYTFPLTQPPIKIPGYTVIMQYDYTLKDLTGTKKMITNSEGGLLLLTESVKK